MKRTSVLSIVVLLAAASTARAAEGTRPMGGPAPVVKEPVTGMELVFVKGGCYRMGDLWADGAGGDGDGTQERPVHEVCVDDFYIGKYEVTQRQWLAVMEKNPSSASNCSEPDCAVDRMTWSDVQAFIAKLNDKAGAVSYTHLTLPTKA